MKHQFDDGSQIAAGERGPTAEAPARIKLQLVSLDSTSRPRRNQASRLVLAIAESLVIVWASVTADAAYHEFILGLPVRLLEPLAIGLLSALLFGGTMHVVEMNQRLRDPRSIEALRDMTFVWLAAMLAVTFFAFALKAGGVLSRGALLSTFALGYVGLVATRFALPESLSRLFHPWKLAGDQVIVIGVEDDPGVKSLLGELADAGFGAPHLFAVRAACSAAEWPRELRRVLDAVMTRAHASGRGEICVASGGFSDGRLRDILAGLKVIPRAVRLVPSAALEEFLHYPIRGIGSLNSIELQREPLNGLQLLVKRVFDVTASTAILVAIAPVLLAIAVAIKLDSRGPIFFKQARLGLRGVPFDVYKLRTMTVMENGDVVKQAQKDDVRVTRIGYWLRRLSLDEFPQLLNVIRGEMSLVGPRPHALAHDRHYGAIIENYEVRQHVKPGMTGWAQVNGLRGPTETPDVMRRRVEYDIWYARNASVALDVKILLLTFVEIFRQRNAH